LNSVEQTAVDSLTKVSQSIWSFRANLSKKDIQKKYDFFVQYSKNVQYCHVDIRFSYNQALLQKYFYCLPYSMTEPLTTRLITDSIAAMDVYSQQWELRGIWAWGDSYKGDKFFASLLYPTKPLWLCVIVIFLCSPLNSIFLLFCLLFKQVTTLVELLPVHVNWKSHYFPLF